MDHDLLRTRLISGEFVDLRSGDHAADDPSAAEQWPAERTVPAALLAEVLTAPVDSSAIHRRIQLAGARISGPVDLRSANLTRSVLLQACVFTDVITLSDAELEALSLAGSSLCGLDGGGLRCRASIWFSHGFISRGEINLRAAQISGLLDCTDGAFHNPGGNALSADMSVVGSSVFCLDGFVAEGEVSFRGAQIGGQLACNGGTFRNRGADALSADNASIRGGVLLCDEFAAEGGVRLVEAHVGGQLDCSNGTFYNPSQTAISADRLTASDVLCQDGFRAEGEVRLLNAQISGQLNCSGGTFSNSGGRALDAERLNANGHVFCRDGFLAEGEVRLAGAEIGGQLDCRKGTFRNLDGDALSADMITIAGGLFCNAGFVAQGTIRLPYAKLSGQFACDGGAFRNTGGVAILAEGLSLSGDMICRDGFVAEGEIRLIAAQVSGQLYLSGATLCNPHGYALHAGGLAVGGDMICGPSFAADGEIRMIGAQIGGQLYLSGAILRNPSGRALAAERLIVRGDLFCAEGFIAQGEVILLGANVGGHFICTGGVFHNPGGCAVDLEHAVIEHRAMFQPLVLEGELDLTYATVGRWCDSAVTWPEQLRLLGFSYGAIECQPSADAKARLGWIRRSVSGYQPQPYEQLAGAYRREGDDAAARKVLIAKQRHRRSSHPSRLRRWPAVMWSVLLRTTIGYGYRPWLVAWPTAALFMVGWWLFRHDRELSLIVPAAGNPPFPRFSAARYALDLLLPVAGLGERARYVALDDAAWHSFAFTLGGWLLAFILVAGLAGVFKHD